MQGAGMAAVVEAVTTAVVLMAAAVMIEGANNVLFTVGELGKRGTAVINTLPTASASVCVAACLASPGCLGLNWMPRSRVSCQTLSSLREVVDDSASSLLVQEVSHSFVPLSYSCATCYGTPPFGQDNWPHECPRPGGVVVGLVAESDVTDLDHLVCTYPRNLTIDYSEGCFHPGGDSCNYIFEQRFLVTSVWSNDQYFSSPELFSNQDRPVSTPDRKVDINRCVSPGWEEAWILHVSNRRVHRVLCPPHMMTVSIDWRDTSRGPILKCCLLY